MMREFRKDKTGFYTRGFLAVAALLGILAGLRIAGYLTASSQGGHLAAGAVDWGAHGAGTAGDVAALLAPSRASAEGLKKSNLFVPPPPKRHPAGNVLGILGDEVLINDKWYKAGDRVGDAKILAVEPTKVRIAWDGQEKDFFPIGVAAAGDSPDRAGGSRPGEATGKRGAAQVAGARGGPAGKPALSEEERNRRREQWQKMSPEERQRARDEMRQRRGATAP
jgi:hypothetical protein